MWTIHLVKIKFNYARYEYGEETIKQYNSLTTNVDVTPYSGL
jgi:hypothetical protein